MRLKQGFIQRKVAGEQVLIPVGSENISNYNGVITLNATAAYICTLMKNEQTRESLIQALLDRYEVDRELATIDVDKVLSVMKEHHMLEE